MYMQGLLDLHGVIAMVKGFSKSGASIKLERSLYAAPNLQSTGVDDVEFLR